MHENCHETHASSVLNYNAFSIGMPYLQSAITLSGCGKEEKLKNVVEIVATCLAINTNLQFQQGVLARPSEKVEPSAPAVVR